MTPPLLPLCEDCDERPRAHRSRRCEVCRVRRKAANKAAWQRQNRDAQRAARRPVSIARVEADKVAAAAGEALAAIEPLRAHLKVEAAQTRQAAAGLRALDALISVTVQMQRVMTN